jgi:hypothetical protein
MSFLPFLSFFLEGLAAGAGSAAATAMSAGQQCYNMIQKQNCSVRRLCLQLQRHTSGAIYAVLHAIRVKVASGNS